MVNLSNQKREKNLRGGLFKALLILIFFISASFICAFGFYVFALKKNISNYNPVRSYLTKLQSGKKYSLSDEGRDNYWLGSAKPKIMIYEFADFNCPLSKNSFSKLREISVKYKNEIKIIFKDFPVYDDSINLAMAGRCAGEQGLFWPMHDRLYQNQNNFDSSNIQEISSLAVTVGVDQSRFDSCMENKKYLSDIQKDYADGQKVEASGTPTWLINGYKISGDIPYNLLVQLIEELRK